METTFLDKKDYSKLYIKQAGDDRKKFWKPVLKLGIVTVIVSLVLNLLGGMLLGESFITQIILQLVGFFISLYSIKFILNLVDTGDASFKDTFTSLTGKQFLYAFGAYVLYILVVYAGIILLIIPGIIWSYMFMMTMPITAEKTTLPIQAMKESRRLTDGYKMKMFAAALSVAVHYLVVPIVTVFLIVLVQTMGWPVWIMGILIAIAVIFAIYAQFAFATLIPRMYRDLQNIKGEDTETSETSEDEVIEVEEVLEGDQTKEATE